MAKRRETYANIYGGQFTSKAVYRNGGEHYRVEQKEIKKLEYPKIHELKTRVGDETLKILDAYCQKNNKKRAEALRDGIYRLNMVDTSNDGNSSD